MKTQSAVKCHCYPTQKQHTTVAVVVVVVVTVWQRQRCEWITLSPHAHAGFECSLHTLLFALLCFSHFSARVSVHVCVWECVYVCACMSECENFFVSCGWASVRVHDCVCVCVKSVCVYDRFSLNISACVCNWTSSHTYLFNILYSLFGPENQILYNFHTLMNVAVY
jgi:hypothetical protein